MGGDEAPQVHKEVGSVFFRRWALLVLRARWLLLAACVALSALCAWQVTTRLHMDNSIEAFMVGDSPERVTLDDFRDIFGRDDFFLVLIEGDVFSRPFVERLEKLHDVLAVLDVPLESTSDAANSSSHSGETAEAATAAAAEAEVGGTDETDGTDGLDAFGDFGSTAWGEEQGGTIVDEIISPINARQTLGEGGGIQVTRLMRPLPDAEALAAMKTKVLADQTLVGQVLGVRGRHAVIAIRTVRMSEPDSARVFDAIVAIAKKHDTRGFRTLVAGPPALGAELNRLMIGDLGRTIGFVVAIILMILLYIFRHPLALVGPLGVVAQAALWTFGTIALLGWSVTLLSNILPAFIVCVGVGATVHVQSVYRFARADGVTNEAAIVYAMATTGKPILFTALTTMLGLLSFRFASVDAIQQLGAMGAFGVGAALLLTLVFLPIVLSFNRTSQFGARASGGGRLDRFLGWCVAVSTPPTPVNGRVPLLWGNRKRLSMVAIVALFVIGGWGASKLFVYHNPLTWMPPGNKVVAAFDALDAEIGGTANVQLLIQTGRPGGVNDLALMRGLEKLEEWLKAWRIKRVGSDEPGERLVGNVVSLLDVLRETNRATHDDDPAWYRLPDTDRGVSDLLNLFADVGGDQARRLVSTDRSTTQMTLRVRWLEANSYGPFTEYVYEGIRRFIPTAATGQLRVRATGAVFTLFQIVSALIGDLIRSFGMAFVVISVMMILLLGEVKLGLVAMVPNLLPIVLIMGVMGFLALPLNMANLLIASIAIGLAVDDTIHFLHHFQAEYRRSGDVEGGIAYSMAHSGRAIVSTSVVLSLGFFVYMSASMRNIAQFGLLVGLTVIFALLIDLMFAPALLRVFYRGGAARPGGPHE